MSLKQTCLVERALGALILQPLAVHSCEASSFSREKEQMTEVEMQRCYREISCVHPTNSLLKLRLKIHQSFTLR